jgi:serine/threonine protein kinase
MESARAGTTCPHCDTSLVCESARHRSICPRCARLLTISGKFCLGEEIDRGGVARIHAAHAEGEMQAVVKVMDQTPLNSWQVHELFARSARLLTGLSHPGLPRVLGFDRSARRSFLVMERFAGGTLYERLKRSGPMRGVELDRLLRGLLEAIGYLHGHGLIHGDVTPRNIMFRAQNPERALDDRPVLVDFDGLCHFDERMLASLVMTPGYSAPEQRAGEMTTAADLYGIGATLVFAATGQSPERLERTGRAMEIDLGRADLSESTSALVQRLVALDPERRPKTAVEALAAMNAPLPVPIPASNVPPRRVAVHPLTALVMLLLACAIAASAFALVRSTSRPSAHTSSLDRPIGRRAGSTPTLSPFESIEE